MIRRDWFKRHVEILAQALAAALALKKKGDIPGSVAAIEDAVQKTFGVNGKLALNLSLEDFLAFACRGTEPSPELLSALGDLFQGWADSLKAQGSTAAAALALARARALRELPAPRPAGQGIEVRDELSGDIAAVRELNRRAFGQDQEADIVDALRAGGNALLSLVATLDGLVVGHILYSRASIGGSTWGAALGPMAVNPAHQRQGIGSKLVEAGNLRIKNAGHPFIIVLGHAEYYPRFGFSPAGSHGVRCEWKVPDGVFMLLVLNHAKMQGVLGLAKYRDEVSIAV